MTFQKNETTKFIRDEKLLAMAEGERPQIKRRIVRPSGIVELIEDKTKLNGWWVKESKRKIDNIAEYPLKKGDTLLLDFGDHQVGRFQVHIDHTGSPMDAPLYIKLRFAEMPAELAVDFNGYEGWLSRSWLQEEYVHIDELPATLALPRRYSFRYVEIEVIDTSPKWQVTFSEPAATAETSADAAKLQPICLEDAELKKIYEVGLKTLTDCMQDVFEDGPKRDRRLWLGDLRLQAQANYATYDDAALVRRCLCLFAGMAAEDGWIAANVFVSPQNVPDDTFLYDYSLFFISVLYDLEQAHPDLAFVKLLYPTCKKQMDAALTGVGADGRVVPDERHPVFADWSDSFNKETVGQAVTIYVLKQFIELAALCGETALASYKEKLKKLSSYAKNVLYDPERRLFVTAGGEYNIASQVWMVLAHVMSKQENEDILRSMVRELFPIEGIATPYLYHCVAEALLEAGLQKEAVQLIKAYWGGMIKLGADTFWEAFDPDHPSYSPYGSPAVNSYCHAWSCAPVYLIRKYLNKSASGSQEVDHKIMEKNKNDNRMDRFAADRPHVRIYGHRRAAVQKRAGHKRGEPVDGKPAALCGPALCGSKVLLRRADGRKAYGAAREPAGRGSEPAACNGGGAFAVPQSADR